MILGNFLHHYPAYDLSKALDLPWCQFVSLLKAIHPEGVTEQDKYDEHKELAETMRKKRSPLPE